jgi:polyribonucleotide nucleotidyltransferase
LGIDIDQSGKVYVYGSDRIKAEAALREVEGLIKEYQLGDIIEGTIVKILDFGAIVEFGVGQSGMIHVSELREGYVKSVSDVVKLNDSVRAKIIRMEDGKIGLTLRKVG